METIHVRLLDEAIPVWRPVKAKRLRGNTFLIVEQEVPDFEEWEFLPSMVVQTEIAESDGTLYQRAIKVLSVEA
jgi:hypothetical protein